jgi:hypothetical protein
MIRKVILRDCLAQYRGPGVREIYVSMELQANGSEFENPVPCLVYLTGIRLTTR